jgi:hypothetical protein
MKTGVEITASYSSTRCRRSRPTSDGWRTHRTNRDRLKCMSVRFLRLLPGKAGSGRSRTATAGRATRSWRKSLACDREDRPSFLGVLSTWDLAPDGKRVAVVTTVSTAEPPKPVHEVVFLENFFDELNRRVPTGKGSLLGAQSRGIGLSRPELFPIHTLAETAFGMPPIIVHNVPYTWIFYAVYRAPVPAPEPETPLLTRATPAG